MQKCSVILFLVFFTKSSLAGTVPSCIYPASWKTSDWFHHYDTHQTTEKWTYTFLNNGDTTMNFGVGFKVAYVCTSLSEEVAGKEYFIVRYFRIAFDHVQCQHIVMGPNIVLERLSIIDQSNSSASECKDKYNDEEFSVMARVPINAEAISTNCPFDGEYHVGVSTTTEPNQCKDISNSKATVTGNKIKINSCITTPLTYASPFDVQLTCLDTFDGSVIDTKVNGGVLILTTKMDGIDRFYCARYTIDGPRVDIAMRVDSLSKTQAACNPGHNFREYGTFGSLKYVHFKLLEILPTTTGSPASTTVAQTPMTTTSMVPQTRVPSMPITTTASSATTAGSSTQPTAHASPSTQVSSTTHGSPPTTPSGGGTLDCDTALCLNDGMCINGACECDDGVMGVNCEIPLPEGQCSDKECNVTNTITCVDYPPTWYYCECTEGFAGPQCSVLDRCKYITCENEGVCTNEPSFFKCHCVTGWEGEKCESASNQTDLLTTDMLILMVLIIVLAVFLFFAVLVAVCACHWNRKRQEKARPLSTIDAPIISNMDADGSHSSIRSWYPIYRQEAGTGT